MEVQIFNAFLILVIGGLFYVLTTSASDNHVPRFAISTTGLTNPQIVDASIPLNEGDYQLYCNYI